MSMREEICPEAFMPIRAKPFAHQKRAFLYACRLFGLLPDQPGGEPLLVSRGCALLMEMGTGKTITSISIVGALSGAGKIRRVLVVAPLSILGGMGGGVSEICGVSLLSGGAFGYGGKEGGYAAPYAGFDSAGSCGEL